MNDARRLPRAALLLGAALLIACREPPTAAEFGTAADGAVSRQFGQNGGPRVRFADLAIFFEFNSTDNDLGLQVFLDAEGWSRLSATSPDGGELLQIAADNELGTLGLTELFFESAEPSPGEVLARFPPGTYEFTGRTVDGGTLVGEASLSHDLPPAPVFTPADGDEVDPANTVIAWDPIPGLSGFQVIVENEDAGRSMTVDLGPSATSLHVPEEFMQPRTRYKAEVLAIATNGNKTITEHTFTTSR